MTRAEEIQLICRKLEDTLVAKNLAYGDSAAKVPALCPELDAKTAILVRMSDKVNRIANLRTKSVDDIGESLNDTVLDLAGYCILYLTENREQDE